MLGEGNRELMAQRSDGSLFDAEISIASTMFSGQRKFIAVIRDISRRRKAEQKQQALGEQLEEMQKQLMQNEKMAAIGQLAAGVAHEINNPVGYIASNITVLDGYIQGLTKLIEAYEASEVLLIQVEGNHGLGLIGELKRKLDIEYLLKDAVELIKESQEGVARVKKIVQDLKDFSHVDEPVWQWANIHLGLDSTLNVVNNELKYKADVIKEYGELPEIECIPSQLNQVFMNLLVNAAHAIEVHGTITIRTGVDDQQGQVWVEIADSGKGIEAENLSRIFDPFYTSKPVGQGTGLGLSLSYGIIDAHHGVIKVESEVGQGTTFRIWLPIEQAEDELLANAASS
jgi:signal transduction histidine kinase